MSIGAMREPKSYQEKDAWLNGNDRAYGTICLGIPPTMRTSLILLITHSIFGEI